VQGNSPREEVTKMSAFDSEMAASLDAILNRVELDGDDLEDEVETAQRAIAW
jgi:hypothetical protein